MAELLHEFRRHNADISYHPIVGSGPNSCVLHYGDNNQTLSDGDLLLVDNFVTGHGRNAYTGVRDVQVALLN